MSISSVEPPQNIIPEIFTIQEPSYDASILYNLRKALFKAAMSREWKTVYKLYADKNLQGEHITRANDTLLHVAVSGATEKIILHLLDIVKFNRENMNRILNLQNKAGDTPLHLAAALGLKKVCRIMANMCPAMVTRARNNLQETPLFSAVRHGKKNTFFVLEAVIHKEQNLKIDDDILSLRDITHCRRGDGNNILHHAIKGEQFDLAYEIICLYPKLAYYVNSNEETALHTLANKPSVFKSGARFGLYDTIIYHCTITEPLTFQFVDFLENEKNNMENTPDIIQQDEKKVLPPNYTVCIDLFSLMKDSVSCIFSTVASNLKSTSICKPCCADEENQYAGARKEDDMPEDEYKPSNNQKQIIWFPPNYPLIIFVFNLILSVIGIGQYWRRETIANLKQKHGKALEIMKVLVDHSPLWEYEEAIGGMKPAKSALSFNEIQKPPLSEIDESYYIPNPSKESPVLVAAKKGITEIVEGILCKYPVAIFDQDKDSKNIVLLAVEHRRVHVYDYMRSASKMESVFCKLDKEGNSALHLAAMLSNSCLWSTGAALHIQWEIKWYKYVRSSMGRESSATTNNAGKMPEEVFIESHDALIKDGITGLTNTCQSCSVVAALFATVAFQSVTTVPGGVDPQSGFPILSKRPVFQLFAISSLLALCFSVTSVVMFLAILISDFKVWDFERRLPVIPGLTSLFMAIAFTLVAFCAGDFYVIESNLKSAAYPIYAIMCFPVTYFAVAQFPLYFSLIKQTIKKVVKPQMVQEYIS